MKILITYGIPLFQKVTNESIYVSFCDPSTDIYTSLTSSTSVDVWICGGEEVTSQLMNAWLDQASDKSKCMLVRDIVALLRIQSYARGRNAHIVGFPEQTPPTMPFEESVLRYAEMLHVQTRLSNAAVQKTTPQHPEHKETVQLVGAGIVNLITAHYLVTRGYRVRILDQGPDPRFCQDRSRLGTTHGGGNARMYTRTEADNYGQQDSKIYQDMKFIFRKTARDGGWSVKPPKDFTVAELDWVDTFESVPVWLARAFKENIHDVNGEGGLLWKEYMEAFPDLFQDVEFHEDILRLYVEKDSLKAAVELNRRLGTILDATDPEGLLNMFPGFVTAAKSDHLAGGFMIDGFTVNIHPFVAKLINQISADGGEFQWDCKVQHIRRNALGQVTALELPSGQQIGAHHFVLSPGVTGNDLLKGTASENLIHGVLGVWLKIPNLEPRIRNSIKIHRGGHLVEDINITVAKDEAIGEDILMFGGGYGYVGLDQPSPDSPELKALFDELESVAHIYFPRGYAAAKERGTLWPGGNRTFCIRPFTPTGLGVFESIPTATGGSLVIVGGNNTGGFAQAPALARAVWRALAGEPDPIHIFFHPDRGRPVHLSTNTPRGGELLSLPMTDPRRPMKLLVLCSDGPQHRYLRHRVNKAFPGSRIIVETNAGQMNQLVKKSRTSDAWYMWYHDRRRHYAGFAQQRKAYFDSLMPQNLALPEPDLTVETLNCREVWQAVEEWQPDLTIVSGTKYIGRKLNERGGLMINLHMGHLPEYKGNHCIFFALYDSGPDKVAGTLHQLTSQLDGGNILDTVFPPILPTDNEETLYTRCLHMTIDRCIEHVMQFCSGKNLEFTPQANTGKVYRHADRTPLRELQLWWTLTAGGLLRKYSINQGLQKRE